MPSPGWMPQSGSCVQGKQTVYAMSETFCQWKMVYLGYDYDCGRQTCCAVWSVLVAENERGIICCHIHL